MIKFKLAHVDDIPIIEFKSRALSDGPDLDELSEALFELAGRSRCKMMVVDLSGVLFLASSALGVLVAVAKNLEGHKGRLAVCGLSPKLQQIMRFSAVDRLFLFRASREEATEDLAQLAG